MSYVKIQCQAEAMHMRSATTLSKCKHLPLQEKLVQGCCKFTAVANSSLDVSRFRLQYIFWINSIHLWTTFNGSKSDFLNFAGWKFENCQMSRHLEHPVFNVSGQKWTTSGLSTFCFKVSSAPDVENPPAHLPALHYF